MKKPSKQLLSASVDNGRSEDLNRPPSCYDRRCNDTRNIWEILFRKKCHHFPSFLKTASSGRRAPIWPGRSGRRATASGELTAFRALPCRSSLGCSHDLTKKYHFKLLMKLGFVLIRGIYPLRLDICLLNHEQNHQPYLIPLPVSPVSPGKDPVQSHQRGHQLHHSRPRVGVHRPWRVLSQTHQPHLQKTRLHLQNFGFWWFHLQNYRCR